MFKKRIETDIEMNFTSTQAMSEAHKGHNFRCPLCGITRINKGKRGEDGWFHTGCLCTYDWLSAHGKLIELTPEYFPGTRRFVG